MFKQLSVPYDAATLRDLLTNSSWQAMRGKDEYFFAFDRFSSRALGLKAVLSTSGKLVDLGCGIGLFSLEASEAHPNIQVVAVGYSFSFDDFVVSTLFDRLDTRRRALGERLKLVQGDAHDGALYTSENGLEMGSVSVVVDYCGALTYSPFRLQLLTLISRLLTPGGRLYVHTTFFKRSEMESGFNACDGLNLLDRVEVSEPVRDVGVNYVLEKPLRQIGRLCL